ncbi:MAG: GNAT family N-acetyltransferase [Anaerolineae bacterium]|nr:GNAT family N-acetyltransferase [Anaerolineae bacterium]
MPSYFFPPQRLETPEFTLRIFEQGDGKLLAEAVRSSYDHLHEFISWATPDYSDDRGEADARRFLGKYLLNEDFVLAITPPDNSRILGTTGYRLFGYPWDNLGVEISMWLCGDVAGKGLGTRVLREMLRWGFTDWPWVRIMWLCESQNLASARVAAKAGMHLEGKFRNYTFTASHHADALQFALVRDEFEPVKLEGKP